MCDCLVALPSLTDGTVTLFAKNSDRPPDEAQQIEVLSGDQVDGPIACTYIAIDLRRRQSLRSVISRPTWCWGAEHGVNEAGVAIGNEAVYTTTDPRSCPDALTGLDLVRLVLMFAATAAEAVDLISELLTRYGQGGSGHDPAGRAGAKAYFSSFLVADPTAAFVIDTSGAEFAVDRVVDGRAISNRLAVPAFAARHQHPRQPVERFVDARVAASQRVLGEPPVTVATLAAHLRSHDSCAEPGWSVCMHARDDGGELVEATTASMIAELRVGQPPVVHALIGSPCEHPYRVVEW